MGEIIPIKPQHIIAHIKMAGFQYSTQPTNSQSGVSRKRRLPGATSAPGWQCESVSRDGFYASKGFHEAEAVKLSYRTKGYAHHEQKRIEQTPILLDYLRQQGYTVKPLSETKSQQNSRWPDRQSFIVYREA